MIFQGKQSDQETNDGLPAFKMELSGAMRRMLALWQAYFSPVFVGMDRLDTQKPALWVGNHTLYGLLDVPLLGAHLHDQYGITLRSLGDRGHFSIPVWRDVLVKSGMVLGTPENCAALMKRGAHVLVFPGGAREVWRRKGEAYKLIWKQRTGFARMAIEHGYDIIPFASLGVDESLDILVDAKDVVESRAWRWASTYLPLDKLTRNGDMIPPLARGLGPTPLPRPQRLYFGFGERITTQPLQGNVTDANQLWQVREQVAASIEDQFEQLKVFREIDKTTQWSGLRRWLTD